MLAKYVEACPAMSEYHFGRTGENGPRLPVRGMTESSMKAERSPFSTIEEALEDIRAGKFVVVVDDEDRENEGDLTIAAQFIPRRRSTSWRRMAAA